MLKMKEERINKGITGAKLARITGLNPSTISSIETRHAFPYPKQAESIAKALKWQGDPADLFKEA